MCRLLWQCLVILLFFMFLHNDICSSSSSPSKPALCSPDQSFALLHFKNSFSIINMTQSVFCPAVVSYPKTERWKEGSDCCSWDGVTCDRLTGQVIGLDVSCSSLFGTLYPNNTLFRLHHLRKLDLSGNDFSGSEILPDAIGDLIYLNELNLAYCGFKGSVPEGLFNLTRLTSLNLSINGFSGRIPASISNLDKLTDLNLNSNEFSGELPSSIFNLTQLSYMDLSANQLEGHFPSQVCALPHLIRLDLSNNLLSGRIPSWLLSLPSLDYLDLSDNKITGQISPEKLGLRHLNLSYNFLTRVVQIPLMKLVVLDLHSNLLQGPLAVPPHGANITFFSVSHNNLKGEIPSMICNMSSLEYLVLANNSFSGMIPECLRKYEELKVLDLSMNNFHGSIPQIFPNGSSLKTIDLNGNQLEGPLPTSLANCSGLEVLDVGNNMVNGTFPFWLAALPEIQVLILRSNRFLGCIGNSGTRFPFAKLRILDISHNQFTGILPTKLFKNFKTMMHGHDKNTSVDYMGSDYYQDHVVLTSKGNELQVERILTILTTFDLSSNQFRGKIPKVVGKLKSLNVFNLSHNCLTGQIPSSLGNLIELESLDLSSNKLVGEIPIQLTSLTFLSVLNVSYNQLVGPIPRGNQFNTFENSSYIGNSKLCGPPLSKKCINDEASQPMHSTFKGEKGTSSTFDQKVIMMGYGSGLVMGLSMGYMVFSTGKPHWFVKIFNRDSVER